MATKTYLSKIGVTIAASTFVNKTRDRSGPIIYSGCCECLLLLLLLLLIFLPPIFTITVAIFICVCLCRYVSARDPQYFSCIVFEFVLFPTNNSLFSPFPTKLFTLLLLGWAVNHAKIWLSMTLIAVSPRYHRKKLSANKQNDIRIVIFLPVLRAIQETSFFYYYYVVFIFTRMSYYSTVRRLQFVHKFHCIVLAWWSLLFCCSA